MRPCPSLVLGGHKPQLDHPLAVALPAVDDEPGRTKRFLALPKRHAERRRRRRPRGTRVVRSATLATYAGPERRRSWSRRRPVGSVGEPIRRVGAVRLAWVVLSEGAGDRRTAAGVTREGGGSVYGSRPSDTF